MEIALWSRAPHSPRPRPPVHCLANKFLSGRSPVRPFSKPGRPAVSRRPLLGLQQLEAREVPAGFVTAPPISALGVLTITGDDDANVVTLMITGAGAVITPDAGTSVNGGAAGAPALVAGTVKSIVANFKGGADVVDINSSAAFTVPGAV